MNKIQRKNPFWSLAGPLLAYIAIQWGVQFVIELVLILPYVIESYADMAVSGLLASGDMEKIMSEYIESLEPAFEAALSYQAEILGAAALASMILTVILFVRDRKLEKACKVIEQKKAPLPIYVLILLLGAAGCIAVTCLLAMAQLAFLLTMAQSALYDAQYQQTAEAMYTSGFAAQLVAYGVLCPLAEELMFRGILFKRFRERKKFWYSAVCSSIFFGFMHTNMTQAVYAFLLGLMLSYLYEKTGSLKAPVLLHIVMNGCSVIFTELGVFRWIWTDPMRMAGAAIGSAFLCSVAFVVIQRLLPARTGADPGQTQGPGNCF